jgi:hypothetical protein
MALAAVAIMCGCSSMSAEKPIMSAAEAQSKIRFVLTVQEAAEDTASPQTPTTVAFVD